MFFRIPPASTHPPDSSTPVVIAGLLAERCSTSLIPILLAGLGVVIFALFEAGSVIQLLTSFPSFLRVALYCLFP